MSMEDRKRWRNFHWVEMGYEKRLHKYIVTFTFQEFIRTLRLSRKSNFLKIKELIISRSAETLDLILWTQNLCMQLQKNAV